MQYRTLGKTGLQVPEVSIGLWAVGGDAWEPVEDHDSLAAIQRAWESGVKLFDTTDVYGRGHSEELLGRFLKTVLTHTPAGGCDAFDIMADVPFTEADARALQDDLAGTLER
jgi:diketogulonate reductase-like aldo/keto reductase